MSTANKFRARLRNDWKRHAARTISSRGGSLESQVSRAEEYAITELIVNPAAKKEEKINTVDEAGHVSQITLAGELKAVNVAESSDLVAEEAIKITETPVPPSEGDSSPPAPETNIEINVTTPVQPEPEAEPAVTPAPLPFRDPAWLSNEQSYLNHTINHLNSLTRSYNLMAPNLARKPYYSLDRELASMYRDVAPLLANEIRERARAPRVKIDVSAGQSGSGVLATLGAGEKVRVWDESKEKKYGLKEFWRDLFASGKHASGN